jgi:hypothetical protein
MASTSSLVFFGSTVSFCCTGASVGGAFLSAEGGAGCDGAGAVGGVWPGVFGGSGVLEEGVLEGGVVAGVVPGFCAPIDGLPIRRLVSASVAICRKSCCMTRASNLSAVYTSRPDRYPRTYSKSMMSGLPRRFPIAFQIKVLTDRSWFAASLGPERRLECRCEVRFEVEIAAKWVPERLWHGFSPENARFAAVDTHPQPN